MVLVHGAAGHAGQFHTMARAIADTGLSEVYALDMRGHGASPGRRGHAVEHEDQLRADLGEFIELIDRRNPSIAIILGGHSAGGGLALRFCRSQTGRRLTGCILIAPYLGLGSATIRPLFGGWVSLHVNRLRGLILANLFGISRFNDLTVTMFNLGPLSDDPDYTHSWSINTTLAFGPGLWSERGSEIDRHINVMSIWGSRDECFFPQAYPDALKLIAPHAQISTAQNCGHWDVLVDSSSTRAVTDWLTALILERRLIRPNEPAEAHRVGAVPLPQRVSAGG